MQIDCCSMHDMRNVLMLVVLGDTVNVNHMMWTDVLLGPGNGRSGQALPVVAPPRVSGPGTPREPTPAQCRGSGAGPVLVVLPLVFQPSRPPLGPAATHPYLAWHWRPAGALAIVHFLLEMHMLGNVGAGLGGGHRG